MRLASGVQIARMAFNMHIDDDDVVGLALRRVRELEETELDYPMAFNDSPGSCFIRDGWHIQES